MARIWNKRRRLSNSGLLFVGPVDGNKCPKCGNRLSQHFYRHLGMNWWCPEGKRGKCTWRSCKVCFITYSIETQKAMPIARLDWEKAEADAS